MDKRLQKAIKRRTELEKKQAQAVKAHNANPTPATKKRKNQAKKALKHAQKVVRALQEGRTPPKKSSAKKGGKKGGKKAAKKSSAKKGGKKAAKKSSAKKGGKKGGKKAAKKSSAKKGGKKGGKKAAKKSSAKKGGKKGGGKKGKKKPSAEAVYRKALKTERQHDKEVARLKKQFEAAKKRDEKAKSAGKNRSQKEIARLEKQQAKLEARIRHHQQAAAEAKAKKAKNKKNKGKKKKNPVNGGWEIFATIMGLVTGGFVVVTTDALLATRSNLQTVAGQLVDQPAQGDVYMIQGQALPIWAQFKRKGVWRLLNFLANAGLPLIPAHFLGKANHKAWQAFFDAWSGATITLGGVKVTTDVGAKLFGKKNIGFKAFPVQLVSQNAYAASKAAAAAPAAAPIQPGTAGVLGMGTGNGASPPAIGLGKDGQPPVGTGCSSCGRAVTLGMTKCSACAKGGGQPAAPQPAPPSPAPTPAPPPGPGFSPPPLVPVQNPRQPAPGGANGAPMGVAGAGGARADVSIDQQVGGGRNNVAAPRAAGAGKGNNVTPIRRRWS